MGLLSLKKHKVLEPENNVYVGPSQTVDGRGVFAAKNIKAKQIVEICPAIILRRSELKHIRETDLNYYYFEFDNKHIGIVLGYGELYNHSYNPNAKYLLSVSRHEFTVVAIKDIKKGEEIFFNYNYYPKDKTPLGSWFKPRVKKN